MINISSEDAEAYLSWLSKVTGRKYCLLSEAVWEYACRAGTETPLSAGDDIGADQAHFLEYQRSLDLIHERFENPKESSPDIGKTVKVGSYQANLFGLFDMHGNVSEMCADHWPDT